MYITYRLVHLTPDTLYIDIFSEYSVFLFMYFNHGGFFNRAIALYRRKNKIRNYSNNNPQFWRNFRTEYLFEKTRYIRVDILIDDITI